VSESELQARIRLAIGRAPHARLFRNNRGLFWAGKVLCSSDTTVTLLHPRRQECGLVQGASDLVGWTTIEITPSMVGQRVAVFTAGEVKPEKRPHFEVGQREFLAAVAAAGGLSAVLRSEDDARRLVRAA
jgi:hypothetical protein